MELRLAQDHMNDTMFLGNHKITKKFAEYDLNKAEKMMLDWPEYKNRIVVKEEYEAPKLDVNKYKKGKKAK